VNLSLRTPLSRRTFLRAGAVCLALPYLQAMETPRQDPPVAAPRRLLLIARNLGLHAPYLFPETPGLSYESTRYLKHLEEHRGSFTIFSGMSHLRYNNHHSEPGLFTGVDWDRIKDPAKEHRNSISLDQFAAERMGGDTRFANLVIGQSVQWPFSWTDRGLPVPSENRHQQVFNRLFMAGSTDEIASEIQRLIDGRSILDQVRNEATALGRQLGAEDRHHIDLMFSSIRDAERRLQRAQEWANKPKPVVSFEMPGQDINHDLMVERETLWLDLVRLAFETDSTRVVLLTLGDAGRPKLDGLTMGHHDASHHGKEDSKIAQLALIEEAELQLFSRFLTAMKQSTSTGGTLFDHTAILHVSNLSNGSAHTCENLPVILAGGGFRHQGHVLHDRKNNVPLSNLYVRVLQQSGIMVDSFGSSTGVYHEV
jgi:Protein of unknown function (DUF1552)